MPVVRPSLRPAASILSYVAITSPVSLLILSIERLAFLTTGISGSISSVFVLILLLDKKSEDDVHHVTVKMLRQNKPNDLFQAVINNAEI